MPANGWIGVDLDGTLAEYHGWDSGAIGQPVPAMAERVKRWLRDGITVKVVTARVGVQAPFVDADFPERQRALIQAWCLQHLGQALEVTASKDFAMLELWDDRCVQVVPNTGEVVGSVRS